MTARLWTNKIMKDVIRMCKEGGHTVKADAETVHITDPVDDTVIVDALAQCTNGPWVVRYNETYFG
jgi:hypothetical protein